MQLWTDKENWDEPTRQQIAAAIDSLDVDDFAILGDSAENFIQTMRLNDGLLVERRAGSADAHFEAIPKDGRPRFVPAKSWWAIWSKPKPLFLFSAAEVVRVFYEYRAGASVPESVDWNQIRI